MAVGNAVLDVVLAPGFLEHVRSMSVRLKQKLAQICDEYPDVIEEIRGEGLMIGLEMHPLRDSIAAHWKQTDSTGMMQYLVPKLDDTVASIPTMYMMNTLMQYHGSYSQVARSNP